MASSSSSHLSASQPYCNAYQNPHQPIVDEWDSDPADVDLYDRDKVDWDGQYSSGRKRKSERDGVLVDMDSFARRFRKPRMETQEEINQRMLSVELAVKEALCARGETNFTDQEFPPNDQSLFVDSENPPSKLQSKDGIFWMSWQDFQIHFRSIYVYRIYPPAMCYSVHGQWRSYSAGGCQELS